MSINKVVISCAIASLTFYEPSVANLLQFYTFTSHPSKSQFGNSISGIVFGFQRQPVGDVDVELLDEFSRYVSRTRTTRSGRYSFSNIRAGRYKVKVMPLSTGYEEQTQEYEIMNFSTQTPNGMRVGGNDSAQIDFFLKLHRGSNEANSLETVFAQDVPSQAKKVYKKAVSALESKNKEEAVDYLNQAITIFPDYYLALEQLGLTYIKLKKHEEARNILTKAVSINARSYMGWYGLAESYFVLKTYTPAVESAKKAVELLPNSIDALLLYGICLKEKGDYSESEVQLTKADSVGKGTVAEVHWQLAKLYADKLKRFDKAAGQLETYLKLDPNNPNVANIKKLIVVFKEKATVNK